MIIDNLNYYNYIPYLIMLTIAIFWTQIFYILGKILSKVKFIAGFLSKKEDQKKVSYSGNVSRISLLITSIIGIVCINFFQIFSLFSTSANMFVSFFVLFFIAFAVKWFFIIKNKIAPFGALK